MFFSIYAHGNYCDIICLGDVTMSIKTIKLTAEELQKCIEFSEQSAKTQQPIEFGQNTTVARKVKEIARDNLIGKMAEVAIVKMLKEDFGIEVPLDFAIYDRGVWDENDIVINGWNIDIKSTRIGHWLLIEWNKLNFRQKNGDLPHVFFMCKTSWDMETDTPNGVVQLIGSISTGRLKAENPSVVVLRKGDFIPKTNTRLQADNFGVEFNNLNSDWHSVISYMLNNNPPDLSNYPNPYTHETVPQYKNGKNLEEIVNTISKNIERGYKRPIQKKKSIWNKILSFFKQ